MRNPLTPRDILAILLLVSVVFLIFNGIDSPLNAVVPLAVGYYFGNNKKDPKDGN